MAKTSIGGTWVFVLVIIISFGVLFVNTLLGAAILLGAVVGEFTALYKKKFGYALGLDFVMSLLVGILYVIMTPGVSYNPVVESFQNTPIAFFATMTFLWVLIVSLLFSGIVYWTSKQTASSGKVEIPIGN